MQLSVIRIKRQHGAGLVSVLIGMLIIGTISIHTINEHISSVQQTLANSNVAAIEELISSHREFSIKFQRPPNSLEELGNSILAKKSYERLIALGVEFSVNSNIATISLPDSANKRTIHLLSRKFPYLYDAANSKITLNDDNLKIDTSRLLKRNGETPLTGTMNLSGHNVSNVSNVTATRITFNNAAAQTAETNILETRQSTQVEATQIQDISTPSMRADSTGMMNANILNNQSIKGRLANISGAGGVSASIFKVGGRDISPSGTTALPDTTVNTLSGITNVNSTVVALRSGGSFGSFSAQTLESTAQVEAGSVSAKTLTAVGNSEHIARDSIQSPVFQHSNSPYYFEPDMTSTAPVRAINIIAQKLNSQTILAGRANVQRAESEIHTSNSGSGNLVNFNHIAVAGDSNLNRPTVSGDVDVLTFTGESAQLTNARTKTANVRGDLVGTSATISDRLTAKNLITDEIRLGEHSVRVDGLTSLKSVVPDVIVLPVKPIGSICESGEIASSGTESFLTCQNGRFAISASGGASGLSSLEGGTWTRVDNAVYVQQQGCSSGCSWRMIEVTYQSDGLLVKNITTNLSDQLARLPVVYANPIPEGYTVVSCTAAFNPQLNFIETGSMNNANGGVQFPVCSGGRISASYAGIVDWGSWYWDYEHGGSYDPAYDGYAWQMSISGLYLTIVAVRE